MVHAHRLRLQPFFRVARSRTRAKTGGKGIRTPGLLIANETLYQLSYTPIYLSHIQTASNYARIKIDSKSIEQAERYFKRRLAWFDSLQEQGVWVLWRAFPFFSHYSFVEEFRISGFSDREHALQINEACGGSCLVKK